MVIEEVEISSLVSDPANVRRHVPRNIDAITASLRRFGQQKPLVIDAAGIVRAGNGTLAAAIALGWTHIQAVRTDLNGSEATAYGIADNRSGDPDVGSTFDDAALADVLAGLRIEDPSLTEAAGFTPAELAKLIADTQGGGVTNDPDTQWEGMPECVSDDLTAFDSVKVNFANAEDREAFAALIGQTVTESTRSLWYPPAPIGRYADKRYVDAS